MDLLNVMRHRRSVRKYTEESVPAQAVEQILQAGMLAASGKAIRPWEMIVVHQKETLQRLSDCREGGVAMLKSADYAIAVVGDTTKSDVWIEDCSLVMANMHLMADSLGIGSCWIQGRLRKANNGQDTDEFVRGVLGYPKEYALEAILVLGMPDGHPGSYELNTLPVEKIHKEVF